MQPYIELVRRYVYRRVLMSLVMMSWVSWPSPY